MFFLSSLYILDTICSFYTNVLDTISRSWTSHLISSYHVLGSFVVSHLGSTCKWPKCHRFQLFIVFKDDAYKVILLLPSAPSINTCMGTHFLFEQQLDYINFLCLLDTISPRSRNQLISLCNILGGFVVNYLSVLFYLGVRLFECLLFLNMFENSTFHITALLCLHYLICTHTLTSRLY